MAPPPATAHGSPFRILDRIRTHNVQLGNPTEPLGTRRNATRGGCGFQGMLCFSGLCCRLRPSARCAPRGRTIFFWTPDFCGTPLSTKAPAHARLLPLILCVNQCATCLQGPRHHRGPAIQSCPDPDSNITACFASSFGRRYHIPPLSVSGDPADRLSLPLDTVIP